jgi:hypothetical protein
LARQAQSSHLAPCYNDCNVRVRIKYALPLAQMALAVALIWLSRRELAAAHTVGGHTPAFGLLILINPPVAMLRGLWFNYVYDPWSDHVMFVASIGVFWYLVGLGIDYWQKRKTLLLFTRKPLRVTADLALIAVGPYFIWLLRSVDVANMPWQLETPALAVVFCWFLGPAFIFGRDLIHFLRSKAPPSLTLVIVCCGLIPRRGCACADWYVPFPKLSPRRRRSNWFLPRHAGCVRARRRRVAASCGA